MTSNCFPSAVQLKSKIRPELNLVICFGSPPGKGCSQMLDAPFCVIVYWRPSPRRPARSREARRYIECLDRWSSISGNDREIPSGSGWTGVSGIGIEATGRTAQGKRDFRPGVGTRWWSATRGRFQHDERRHELHRLRMADGTVDATPARTCPLTMDVVRFARPNLVKPSSVRVIWQAS